MSSTAFAQASMAAWLAGSSSSWTRSRAIRRSCGSVSLPGVSLIIGSSFLASATSCLYKRIASSLGQQNRYIQEVFLSTAEGNCWKRFVMALPHRNRLLRDDPAYSRVIFGLTLVYRHPDADPKPPYRPCLYRPIHLPT